MGTLNEVMAQLKEKARPEQLDGMARYGMDIQNRLGIAVPELRKLAKSIGKDHALALELWESGIDDARILASMVDTLETLDRAQMDSWVMDFNSWDVCDQVCMNLFDKTPLAWGVIYDWAGREEEFVRRAAFSLIACLAWHDKTASDEQFIQFFPLIEQTSRDERNYVRKAVNWALRQIGKRNQALNTAALQLAHHLQGQEHRTARWIGADAIRDMTSAATQRRFKRQRENS
jgi:3-methyladenine DNA glycosylase AlkD